MITLLGGLFKFPSKHLNNLPTQAGQELPPIVRTGKERWGKNGECLTDASNSASPKLNPDLPPRPLLPAVFHPLLTARPQMLSVCVTLSLSPTHAQSTSRSRGNPVCFSPPPPPPWAEAPSAPTWTAAEAPCWSPRVRLCVFKTHVSLCPSHPT